MQAGETWLAWLRRLADGVPIDIGSLQLQLKIVMPHFLNLAPSTLNEALQSEDVTTHTVAELARNLLTRVQGIVFVVDSNRLRMNASQFRLQRLREDLRSVGVDPDGVPCVFQLNQRDSAHAVSIADAAGQLAWQRCAFVESVAPLRYGTLNALETLISLIEGHAIVRPAPPRNPPTTVEPNHLLLFESRVVPLTEDELIRERIEVRAGVDEMELEDTTGIARGWPQHFETTARTAKGRYIVDLVLRHTEHRLKGDWKQLGSPVPIAARLRHASVVSARFAVAVTKEFSAAPFVIVGSDNRVRAVTQESIAPMTYNTVAANGYGRAPGLLVFGVGTSNEFTLVFGHAADGSVVEIAIYGDDAHAVMTRAVRAASVEELG